MPGQPPTDDNRVDEHTDGWSLNMLNRDKALHMPYNSLMERKARMSREAWGRSMDASDLAHSEVMSLRTTVFGQQAVIIELQAADRRETQGSITEDCG
ncbi:hypothetical protein Tco_0252830 [Tanacetum coccineum]